MKPITKPLDKVIIEGKSLNDVLCSGNAAELARRKKAKSRDLKGSGAQKHWVLTLEF